MNWRSFVSKIGFAVMLAALSLSNEGFLKVSVLLVAGIIALAAIMLFLRNMSSKPGWKSFIRWADEELDFTYIAFGFGLVLNGSKFLSSGWSWASFLLFVSGILFTSYALGQFLGKGFSRILKDDAKIGIIIGCLCLICGVVWCIVTWKAILDKPLFNNPGPIFVIVLGILFVSFGWKKWCNSRTTS